MTLLLHCVLLPYLTLFYKSTEGDIFDLQAKIDISAEGSPRTLHLIVDVLRWKSFEQSHKERRFGSLVNVMNGL